MKRTISLLMILAILLSLTVPAMAADDATGTTLRLEETNGAVTVKDAAGKDKTAREGMRLYSGYTIATGASSSAYISLDETKAVKLDSSGKVEIKKSGKKLEVSLTSGQLYFNVTEPLKVDESLNIRTSTMVTGIRGSFGWVNLTQMGLMHGHVTLTCMNPETGETRVTEIYTGEKVSYEQAAAGGGDAELAEIDFVKEEIVLEDVPATVVEEIAKDETLRSQLAEAATEALAADETARVIDVAELVESLEEKQATEAAEEAAAQAEVEAAVIAQEAAIVAAAAGDAASGGTDANGTTANYVDLSANTTPVSGGGGDGGTVTETPYTVSASGDVTEALKTALSSYTTVIYSSGSTGTVSDLTIPSGKTLIIAPSGDTLTYLDVSTALTNYGTITIQANAMLNIRNGAVGVNASSATINIVGGLSNSGEFTNEGTIHNNNTNTDVGG